MDFQPDKGVAKIPLDDEADGALEYIRKHIKENIVRCNLCECMIDGATEGTALHAQPKRYTIEERIPDGANNCILVVILCETCSELINTTLDACKTRLTTNSTLAKSLQNNPEEPAPTPEPEHESLTINSNMNTRISSLKKKGKHTDVIQT